jgi:hypothetical protein
MSTVECIACGHVGATKVKGSFFITLILLWFAIVPGVIYEIWRRSGGKVCSACGSSNVKLYVPRPVQVQQQPQVEPLQNRTKLVATDMFAHNAGNKAQLNDDGVEQKNCPDCRELIRFDARKCKHCGSMIGDAT